MWDLLEWLGDGDDEALLFDPLESEHDLDRFLTDLEPECELSSGRLLTHEFDLELEWELLLEFILARELGLEPTGDIFLECLLVTELDREELLLADLSGELDGLLTAGLASGDSDGLEEFLLLFVSSGDGDRDSLSLFSGLLFLSSVVESFLWFSLSLWKPFSPSSSPSSEEWCSEPSSESESVSAYRENLS